MVSELHTLYQNITHYAPLHFVRLWQLAHLPNKLNIWHLTVLPYMNIIAFINYEQGPHVLHAEVMEKKQDLSSWK